ncbi:DNA mismatch repair endonuclease MutL [Cohaesibacter gelatinilyticus]|uniref:DNA mismatch repair protein MutL n=1 Tax=Cohaesibacter gelatinilyticus TaxID=372072 RepID=A0A285N930_9HYPH|nr:DNA mismatch repair endonuclease MutL [Cohaesibacter gelatinilyticus]SNZ05423.1 DNA mismatch repair protein MutL [Cohaesibacter gelatinilyticus]
MTEQSTIIRQLDDATINKIAAGEVVERPASVVKELVENSIDAGASRIEIVTAGGGKNLIRISDDGIGMTQSDLALAIQRHCTSKLDPDDLMDIRHLGFRGEALPSIGSIAKLSITTRHHSEPHAWEIEVQGGTQSEIRPAALTKGTRIEVEDLFFSTPARLKFLKTDRAENTAISEIIKRIALAHPEIRFTLTGADRSRLDYAACKGNDAHLVRMGQVMGKAFRDNAVEIDAIRDTVRLTGFAGLPTLNRANSLQQFVFVNGRPVKDKTILGAIRGAYVDFLAGNRYPCVVLFIDLDPHEVDVNVHPTKADVRFRDPQHVRGLVVGAIRRALMEAGHRATTTGGDATLAALRPDGMRSTQVATGMPSSSEISGASMTGYASPPVQPARHQDWNWRQSVYAPQVQTSDVVTDLEESAQPYAVSSETSKGAFDADVAIPTIEQQGRMMDVSVPSADARAGEIPLDEAKLSRPLGAARAQIHENYIIAQTEDGLVIVDQHAAHERLVYERLKSAIAEKGIAKQGLLIPHVVEMDEDDVARLDEAKEELQDLGLSLDAFGPGAVAVRETPAILGKPNLDRLVRDIADDLAEWDKATRVEEKIHHVAATMACHGSVRSGRRMRAEEMDALLREMEATPHSGQCNHGRPTYVELKLSDIERLFGRSG